MLVRTRSSRQSTKRPARQGVCPNRGHEAGRRRTTTISAEKEDRFSAPRVAPENLSQGERNRSVRRDDKEMERTMRSKGAVGLAYVANKATKDPSKCQPLPGDNYKIRAVKSALVEHQFLVQRFH
jgi:hypothetical protein